MTAPSAHSLLRECAVLLMALAFIVSGALAPRQHAEAAALGLLSGATSFVCHGEGDSGGDPAKLPAGHACEQCLACHLHGAAAEAAALPGVARDWLAVERASGTAGLFGARRTALPFATGPPAIG